jgi:hypothetical protein
MNSWDLPRNEKEAIGFIIDMELFQANATEK